MQTKLNVEGMSCSHCENAVKNAVLEIDGVSNVEVDLEGKSVTVTHEESVSVGSIKDAISEEGYEV